MDEVLNRRIDVRQSILRVDVEVVIDYPHTAAGDVSRDAANGLILENGRLRPLAGNGVVRDGFADNLRALEEERSDARVRLLHRGHAFSVVSTARSGACTPS